MDETSASDPSESRLAEALAEYMLRLDAGQSVDRQEFLARYPDIAPQLREHFSQEDALGEVLGHNDTLSLSDVPEDRRTAPARRDELGDYEILGEIARGGMGIVYKARQKRLNRVVALKTILSDRLVSSDAVERFYSEARAAARLQHQGIVAIHEVGESDGRQFFSMDYVEGVSLAEATRDEPLPVRKAAEFAKQIAEAVQYAHEQGVLHRDLKPSNVLIDNTGRPRVTDFGLAKQVEDDSELTRTGQVLGTASFMPPEQALGRQDQIDVRSDVYSLGALLYALVTGRPPFRAESSAATLMLVIDSEPLSPRLLNPSVDRDLETICLTCLQKAAERRYATASALAGDLARYLARQPIEARPVRKAERAWRWCRRNPVVAGLATATAFCILLALVVAIVGYVQTSQALATAETARQEADTARQRSDASLRHALAAVDSFCTRVSDETLLNVPRLQPLRKALLIQARDYYQTFLAERSADPLIRDALADAQFRLAAVHEAIGTSNDALAAYARATQMQRALVAAAPGNVENLAGLATTLNAIGKVQLDRGRLAMAEKAYREAAEIRQRVVVLDPKNVESGRKLANVWMNLGLLEKERGVADHAQQLFEKSQALRSELLVSRANDVKIRRDLAKGHFNLADWAQCAGDLARADQHLAQAVEGFSQIVEQLPESLEDRFLLAWCLRVRADLQMRQRRPDKALRRYQRAIEQLTRLAEHNPDVTQYAAEAARVHMNLGQLYADGRDWPEATTQFEEGETTLMRLVAGDGMVPEFQRDLAICRRGVAVGLLMAGGDEKSKAVDLLRMAIATLTQLAESDPDNGDYQKLLSETREMLAQIVGREA